jgi:hypothetical protein
LLEDKIFFQPLRFFSGGFLYLRPTESQALVALVLWLLLCRFFYVVASNAVLNG